MANEERQVLRVHLDPLDQADLPDREEKLDLQDLLVQAGHVEKVVPRDLMVVLVNVENEDLLGQVDPLVLPVLLDRVGAQVNVVSQVPGVNLELLEVMVVLEQQVQRDPWGLKVLLVQEENLVQLGHLVLVERQEKLAQEDLMVSLVLLDLPENVDLLDQVDLLDLPVNVDPLDQVDPLVKEDLMDQQVTDSVKVMSSN